MADMKWIKNGIIRLVTGELSRTINEYGYFVDDHQAYSVIREEYEEALDELDHFAHNKHCLWTHIKADSSDENKLHMYDKMRKALNHAAAELVQASAMCEKAMCSIEKRRNEDDSKQE